MIDKEFVLVSQGIEIYRTKSQEKAVGMVKEHNDEYFDYKQKCYDNYERPADNYVDLEIEYPNEKEKDKEIKRLKEVIEQLKLCNSDYYNQICTLSSKISLINKYINEEKNDIPLNIKDYINKIITDKTIDLGEYVNEILEI